MTDTPTKTGPTQFGFLLINHFTLISMSSAVEPLRMANRICRDEVYKWKLISETGAAVHASDGLSINVDNGIDDRDVLSNVDVVIICGGWNVEQNTSEPVLRWLRTIGKSGVAFGSTCTGSYLLASAGLLDGYRCSVHWENMGALADLFPKIHVSRSVYTIDRDRYTCSGGTAPVDMMLHFINARCGNEVSTGVAEQFIHERIRRSGERQRIPLKYVVGKQSEKLVIAVELMEANIKEPMGQADIASYTGVSRRQ